MLKAHRLSYHSTLGSRVMQKKKKKEVTAPLRVTLSAKVVELMFEAMSTAPYSALLQSLGLRVEGLVFKISGLGFRV